MHTSKLDELFYPRDSQSFGVASERSKLQFGLQISKHAYIAANPLISNDARKNCFQINHFYFGASAPKPAFKITSHSTALHISSPLQFSNEFLLCIFMNKIDVEIPPDIVDGDHRGNQTHISMSRSIYGHLVSTQYAKELPIPETVKLGISHS